MNSEKDLGMLSLIFADDTVQYRDRILPTGSIACMALNIPKEDIDAALPLCQDIATVNTMLRTGIADKTEMSSARMAAHTLLELMSRYEPFTYFSKLELDQWLDDIFSEDAIEMIQSAIFAVLNGQIDEEAQKKFKAAATLSSLAPVLANYYDAVTQLQEHVGLFAEKLGEKGKDRTKEAYLRQFMASFPERFRLGDGSDSWMSMMNVTAQYTAGMSADGKHMQMKKHMHFVSLGGMLRADFFEGLAVGHAPKRCAICGRWFLTTDARHTKYCSEICPTDPKGRKCRAIGALHGRQEKERAEDHPLNKLYQRRMNTIDQNLRRGTLTPELAKMMKKLAKDKHQRAISDINYAKGAYEAEMKQKALKAEALKQMQ